MKLTIRFFGSFLVTLKEIEIELFRKYERNGRPSGKTTFVKQLETILNRRLGPKKSGQKKIRKVPRLNKVPFQNLELPSVKLIFPEPDTFQNAAQIARPLSSVLFDFMV